MNHDQSIATFCAVFAAHGLDAAVDAVAHAPEFKFDDSSFEIIVDAVCESYETTRDRLFSRERKLADARHVAMWLVGQAGASLPRSGQILHGFHHTTCLHAVKRVWRTPNLLERAGILLAACKRTMAQPTISPGIKSTRNNEILPCLSG